MLAYTVFELARLFLFSLTVDCLHST